MKIAETKTLGYAHFGVAGLVTAFVRAILCNWMVCLGVVMALASTSTIGRIVGRLTGESIAIMCSACRRGAMTAGPDGIRDPDPNTDAAS